MAIPPRYVVVDLVCAEDCVGFDFHQHFRGDQAAHLDHAGCWADGGEEFAVGAADFLPLGNINDKDSCAHDVLQTGTGLGECRFDVADGLHRLRVDVAYADDFAVRPGGGGSGHGDHIA